MPTLRIDTNVSKSKIDLDAFSTELTTTIAESLSKPIGYVMVIIHPDVAMTYGEGAERNKPAAYATLMSIGQLGVEENKKHACRIQGVIKKHLDVDPKRCFIYFNDAKSSEVGYDSSTFHDILG